MDRAQLDEYISEVLATKPSRLDWSYLTLTDDNVRYLVGRLEGLTELRSLEAGEQADVTDAGVVAIAQYLTSLNHLDIFYCENVTDVGLQAIAQHLTNLSYLDIGACKRITDFGLNAIAQHLANLNHLDIGYCENATDVGVQAIAQHLTNLSHLDIGYCVHVTDAGLQAIAQHLTNLNHLYIRECENVTDVGVQAIAKRLTKLNYLSLGRCKGLTDAGVQAIAQYLTNLSQLDISVCGEVTDVGMQAIAKRLTKLKSLNLGRCKGLTDAAVQAIAQHLTNLNRLDISMCAEVTDVGVQAIAQHLTNLNHLDIGWCEHVTDAGLQAIAQHVINLNHLVISYCAEVTDVGVQAIAQHLTDLNHLDISGCAKVTDAGLQAIGKCLTKLTIFSLRGTAVRSIPVEMQNLRELRRLRLPDNPELGLPSELLKSGDARAILRHYFRGTSEGRRQLNEAKVLVVGAESVGKTSLVRFLIKEQPRNSSEPKTSGVQIHERIITETWQLAGGRPDEAPIRLNVWDFGGQEVMYETHRFFLSKRSLYLLVLEARREDDDTIHDWMKIIGNRAADAPVIVVINKAEPPHELRLDETKLMRDYPSIVGFVRTSCDPPSKDGPGGRGIDELRQMIQATVREKLPDVRDWFPASYFQVKEELADVARKESVLSTHAYRGFCVKHGVSEEREQNSLLDLLDQIGVVVSHHAHADQHHGSFKETTLLDPNWVTTAVYGLLTHTAVRDRNGELALEDLGKLLVSDRYQYPSDRWQFIIDMMRQFGLCYELADCKNRYLVPEQLPTNEPDLNFDERTSLRFRIDYEILPRGLLPRLIVQAHALLTARPTAWLTGVVLQAEECKVLVRADRAKREVHLFVQGPPNRRRAALAIVRSHLEVVHRINPETKPREMVPLPDRPDLAMDYETLVKMEDQGEERCWPPGADHPYPVKELLNGVDQGARRRPQEEKERDRAMRESWDEEIEDFVRDDRGSVQLPLHPSRMNAASPTPPTTIPTAPAWRPFVAPTIAAAVTVILVGLMRWDPAHPVTVSCSVFAVVFAAVYLVQARWTWKSEQWTKYVMFGLIPLMAAAALLPSVKLFLDSEQLGRFEALIENSPWLVAVLMLGLVLFGFIQVYRERHGLQPK